LRQAWPPRGRARRPDPRGAHPARPRARPPLDARPHHLREHGVAPPPRAPRLRGRRRRIPGRLEARPLARRDDHAASPTWDGLTPFRAPAWPAQLLGRYRRGRLAPSDLVGDVGGSGTAPPDVHQEPLDDHAVLPDTVELSVLGVYPD